jgi:hypothetical protein
MCAMNDDTERAICPVCGREITVVLDFQGDEPDTGIRAHWFGGISVEDGDCFQHLTWQQREDVVGEAIHLREERDEAEARADIERDLDEMYRHTAHQEREEQPEMAMRDALAATTTDGSREEELPPILEHSERLGREVREEWVSYAHTQPNPKPHHLLPWEELDEASKEVDRRIGDRLFALGWQAALDLVRSCHAPDAAGDAHKEEE